MAPSFVCKPTRPLVPSPDDPTPAEPPVPADDEGRAARTLRRAGKAADTAMDVVVGVLGVWRGLSEAAGREEGERELTILFTDLVGFSTWALDAGDDAAVALLGAMGAVVDDAVAEHRGRLVKRLGDGVMAAFDTPAEAVGAALHMHRALGDVRVAGHRPRMRAGVHHGRPQRVSRDYVGVDVNIAARVAEAAKAGQTLATTPTCELLDEAAFAFGRPRRLRAAGAPRELRVRLVRAR